MPHSTAHHTTACMVVTYIIMYMYIILVLISFKYFPAVPLTLQFPYFQIAIHAAWIGSGANELLHSNACIQLVVMLIRTT